MRCTICDETIHVYRQDGKSYARCECHKGEPMELILRKPEWGKKNGKVKND